MALLRECEGGRGSVRDLDFIIATSEVVRTLIEELGTTVEGRMIIDTTTGDPSDVISFDGEPRIVEQVMSKPLLRAPVRR